MQRPGMAIMEKKMKGMGIGIVPENIEDYCLARSQGFDPLLDELLVVTEERTDSLIWVSGPLVGGVLRTVASLIGARRIVEVGMFTGYSTLMMAAALPKDGKLITCDVNPKAEAVARRFFDRSPDGGKIHVRMGPALETLDTLEGPFDFAFIDADKVNYIHYYEKMLPMLRPGGWIAADNTLWNGRVVSDPAEQDDDTRALVAFSRHVAGDDRVTQTLLTVRDGITLIHK
jgi:caffeoyl-CoA O-methyltransferase